jgi:hypothetical protein
MNHMYKSSTAGPEICIFVLNQLQLIMPSNYLMYANSASFVVRRFRFYSLDPDRKRNDNLTLKKTQKANSSKSDKIKDDENLKWRRV